MKTKIKISEVIPALKGYQGIVQQGDKDTSPCRHVTSYEDAYRAGFEDALKIMPVEYVALNTFKFKEIT